MQVPEVELLKVFAEESLLSKAIARSFNIRHLREANIDLNQLFT